MYVCMYVYVYIYIYTYIYYLKNSIGPNTNPFFDPFLNSGITFASFHYEGTVPSSSDKLNTFARGVLICCTISLSSFGGIPITPGDLLSFIF